MRSLSAHDMRPFCWFQQFSSTSRRPRPLTISVDCHSTAPLYRRRTSLARSPSALEGMSSTSASHLIPLESLSDA